MISETGSGDSIDEFKAIFIGVVQGHHWAWEVAGVLHRDISMENIMFYRSGSEVVGMLNDWDHAEEQCNLRQIKFDIVPARREVQKIDGVSNEQNTPNNAEIDCDPPQSKGKCSDNSTQTSESQLGTVKARYRAGTIPFMAIELLQAKSVYPFHRYRFDIESFCYVLVWFCLGFDPQKHTVAHIERWDHEDLMRNAWAKLRFLEDHRERKILWNRARSKKYLNLCKTWAVPISHMLCDVQERDRAIKHLIIEDYVSSPEQLSDKIGGWKREVASYEQAREQVITYEKVMNVLLR
ncbi:hypothetical protein OBBRIDRAFT_221435 [Obba rivulosa]|uniref:Protein kinase domain-containing protein n=1 Tax=Obba rivulosa TaxID=1052685 RepID=A0A8E2DL67_9APHY|nr:hypothetical protein OBBRIDRAFT_221435 [Obba rivulosa]